MHKVFKYRLYPTKSQRRLLQEQLDACRWVYNKTIEVRQEAWEQRRESLSLYDTHNLLPAWKKDQPFLKTAYSQSLQNAQVRVDLAFKAFFRRVKAGEKPGYPRFRGTHRYDSFTCPQYPTGCRLIGNSLRVNKVGEVKLIFHRPIEGTIKTATVRKTPTGKWFVFFSAETESHPLPENSTAVGIDVGLKTFATLSDGKKVKNPRFFKTGEKALAKAQRRLEKVPKGSRERSRRRRTVARIHERIGFQRHNFVHQTALKIIQNYGVIAVEDLDIKGLIQKSFLTKSIADVAWGQFLTQLSFKAEDAGRKVIRVNPRNTSKRCSRCGTLVEKDLSVRVHDCPVCLLRLDRDLNASINILALGLQSVGATPRSLRSLRPGE